MLIYMTIGCALYTFAELPKVLNQWQQEDSYQLEGAVRGILLLMHVMGTLSGGYLTFRHIETIAQDLTRVERYQLQLGKGNTIPWDWKLVGRVLQGET